MGWFNRKTDTTAVSERAVSLIDGNTGQAWVAGSPLGAAGNIRKQGLEGLTTSAAVQRCLTLIVNNLAAQQLEVLGPTGDPVPTHPLVTRWNKTPNPNLSAFAFHQMRQWRKEKYGEVHILLDRGVAGTGPVRNMTIVTGPIRRLMTAPTTQEPYGALVGWEVKRGNTWDRYSADEVLWDRYVDPDDPWGALSPIAALLTSIGLGEAARKWQAGSLTGGAMPNLAVVLEGADANAVAAATGNIRAALTGAHNAGKAAVLGSPVDSNTGKPYGVQVHQLSFSAAEVAFLDTVKASNEEIALGLGVPVDLVGGQRTFNNLAEAHTQFWSDTLLAKAKSTSSEVDRMLLPDPQIQAEFNFDDVDALHENRDAVFTRWRGVLTSDGCTLNEYREKIGLKPLTGGDVTWSQWKATVQLDTAMQLAAAGIGGQVTPQRVTVEQVHTPPIALTAGRADAPVDRKAVVTPAEQILREYDRNEAAGQRAVKRLARDMEKQLVARYKKAAKRAGADHEDMALRAEDQPTDWWNAAEWEAKTYAALLPWLETVWMRAAHLQADGLGYDLGDPDALLALIEARCRDTAKSVTGVTGAALADAVTAGVAAGESTADIAKRITGVCGALGGHRAERIARTEVVGGHNQAARWTAIQSNIPGLKRRWMDTDDDRTRASHKRLDGHETEGLYDPYPNGLMHPGDPNGKPEEVINCRCVEEYITQEEDNS